MNQDSDLLEYVRSGLRSVGPRAWPEIAERADKPLSTLRKLAYRDRRNPKLQTIEPIAKAIAAYQESLLQ